MRLYFINYDTAKRQGLTFSCDFQRLLKVKSGNLSQAEISASTNKNQILKSNAVNTHVSVSMQRLSKVWTDDLRNMRTGCQLSLTALGMEHRPLYQASAPLLTYTSFRSLSPHTKIWPRHLWLIPQPPFFYTGCCHSLSGFLFLSPGLFCLFFTIQGRRKNPEPFYVKQHRKHD